MAAAATFPFPSAVPSEAITRTPLPPKASWSLMGDILSARGGVPEHLIEWCRATGEDDPASQL